MEAMHLPGVEWTVRCVDGQDTIDLKQASHALLLLLWWCRVWMDTGLV
jgi:hypothetical protein